MFRVYFLIETQYDFLQFVYDGSSYKASVEFEINLKDESSNKLKSKIFQTQLLEEDFKTTNRKNLFHFALDSLDTRPGRYEVIFKYRDKNGKRRQQSIEFKIHLPAVDQFYASPVLFIHPEKSLSKDYRVFDSQPSALRSYWDFSQKIGIQLNTWQAQPDNSLKVNFEIMDPKEEQSIFSTDTLLGGKSHHKTLHVANSENLLNEQEYQIKIDYLSPSDTIEHKFPLNIVWFEKPFSLWNLKTAIGPLEYLMENEEEFDEFNEGNDQEKLEKLREFWKERDPTPNTPFNELKYEFYSRVDSANAKYSRKRYPGWRTDIGEIYILYGPPDEIVDNSLAPIKHPFLRWIYYQDNKKLSFTFLALDGRKRYKLAKVEENSLQ